MSDFINTDDIVKRLKYVIDNGVVLSDGTYPISSELVLEYINESEHVDIIRCKDCSHKADFLAPSEHYCMCGYWGSYDPMPNGFCNFAIKKETDEEDLESILLKL